MSFFSVPLSGLVASQNQLQTVSNNLSNLSTAGYKDQNLTFNDVYAEAEEVNGSGDPIQTGLGVKTGSSVSKFSNGSVTSTGIASNMALSGNGFFEAEDSGGTVVYTRAGDFTTNSSGQIVDNNGNLVLGYPATNGVVNTASAPTSINVGSGVTAAAVQSTKISLSANLNSATTVSGSSSLQSSVAVYDSLGQQHTLSVAYTKTAANTWTYNVTIPSSDLTSGATGSTSLATGTLTFSSSGVLTSVAQTTPTAVAAASPSSISISTGTSNLADGAKPINVSWNLLDSSGSPTLTQTASSSTTSATSTDGSPSGSLTSYSIGSDGTVTGTFSSGATQSLGQVAVATVINLQGLKQLGNNDYQVTSASGPASVGVAGTGGRGTITGGSVESSNVDTATEFAKMIVAQQAYSGNAKVVTTFKEVSQATIAMVS